MLAQPVEERLALERLEAGALTGERVVEVHPHVGKIIVEEDRGGAGVAGRVRAEQPPERREREAPVRRLRHDPDRRERAQEPIDAIGIETARACDGGSILGAPLHDVGEAEPRERPDGPSDPEAAQQLQHLFVQLRRAGGSRRLVTLTVHDPFRDAVGARPHAGRGLPLRPIQPPKLGTRADRVLSRSGPGTSLYRVSHLGLNACKGRQTARPTRRR